MFLFPMMLFGAAMAIWDPKRLYLLLAFCTPLSLNLENLTGLGGIGFYLPTEPFLFALMLLVIAKIFNNYKWDSRIIYHPVSFNLHKDYFTEFLTYKARNDLAEVKSILSFEDLQNYFDEFPEKYSLDKCIDTFQQNNFINNNWDYILLAFKSCGVGASLSYSDME